MEKVKGESIMVQEKNLKERVSNFELLRIVSMLMIIMFHIQQNVASEESTFYKAIVRSAGVSGGNWRNMFCYDFFMVFFRAGEKLQYRIGEGKKNHISNSAIYVVVPACVHNLEHSE